MSESSQRLAQDIKDEYLTIPWRETSGFCNVLVHDYLGLDLECCSCLAFCYLRKK
ncbi:MAG: DUF86 domain-containing protein, partial [Saprospiraceae bacterium]|nr:DUF86 domain-containing protein [Saprospiraceae bacterium]